MPHRISKLLIVLLFIGLSAAAQERVSVTQVVALALEKNYDVQLAKNAADATNLDQRYAPAAFLPQVTTHASKTWSNTNQRQRLADNTRRNYDGIKSENITASVDLAWTLFDGTKMFITRRRVAALAVQGELALKDAMVNTVADVVSRYYQVVALKQQLRATREQMAVNEERVKLADRKLEVGTGGKPELLQAKVDLNAQRVLALQQQTAIEQLKESLNALVGMQLPQNYLVADTILIDLSLASETLVANMESHNYSLQVARQNTDISKLLLKEQRADYFPVIDFISNYTFSQDDRAVAINSFTPLFNRNEGYDYGFSLSWPILTGFNTRRLIQQATLNVARQELLYEQEKTNIAIALKNAYTAYDNARQVLQIEEDNILLAKENVFIALEGFKRGITTYIELRTAQQSLEEAYTRLIDARYSAKVAEVELLRLSGALLQREPGV